MILSKNCVFVEKDYSCNGMFKLSINKIDDISLYFIDSSYSLRHDRLEHVNHKTLQHMFKNGLILFNDNVNKKYEVCIQIKITRLSFPEVERNSQLLNLVYSDVYELNEILTKSGNRYFITFIDDCSRYVHVYLMKIKDGTFYMF